MKTSEKTNLFLGLITVIGVIILITIIGWIVFRPTKPVIQGQAEATEVRISGKLAGRIIKFRTEEGSFVKQGDTLVILESPELDAKLTQAKAAKNAAQAQNLKAINGARVEQIQGAYEMWQKAKVGVDITKKSLDRVKKLFDNGVIAAQKFDEAQAQYDAAVSTEKGAKSQYDMAINGSQKEDKMAASAMVDRAKGAVSEVEAYMKETHLVAPISGEISEIFPKVGELVGQGAPIMSIVNLDDSWITFNVREDLLGNMKMGSELVATIPALNNKEVKLKVTYIKALGSYATWKATKTTGGFDAITFEVRAKPIEKIDGLRPGMTALVK
jgi:HlyD family secretion protein